MNDIKNKFKNNKTYINGYILYGFSKKTISKAIANKLNAHYIYLNCQNISKLIFYVGTFLKPKILINALNNAKKYATSVIYLDN